MTTQFLEASELTAVCHVRTALVLEPIDAKVETLRACEADGGIADLVVRSWPAEVELDSDGPYHEVIDRFAAFERWADRHGIRVRPAFSTREKTTLASDGRREVLVTPTLCLALYDEDRLVGVYPHSDGETTVTATEAVAALRTGELPPVLGTAPTDVRVARDRFDRTSAVACPDCEGELANVQGLLACTDCDWTDSWLGTIDSPRAKLVYLALLDGPVSIEALARAVDLNKLALYGVLRALSERDLVEEVAPGTYRARREPATDGRPSPADDDRASSTSDGRPLSTSNGRSLSRSDGRPLSTDDDRRSRYLGATSPPEE